MKQEQAAALFAEKMKQYLRRAKVRQLYLATLLEVTPSAVCQMLKCRILMNAGQLNTIAKGLKLAEDELLELQILLSNVRNGENSMRSPFNRFMKNCRRSKKLSISRLAQLSGISALRLKSFENDFNAVFTFEDAQKLSAIFECTPEFMMKKIPEVQNIVYPQAADMPVSAIEVADGAQNSSYNPTPRVPIVALEDFENYSANVDLFAFGDMRSCDEMAYCIEKRVVGIRSKVRYFKSSIDGDIILFVTDKKPLVYVCSLFLCLDTSKKFHLLRKKEDSDEFYSVNEQGEKITFKDKIRWSLGIIDIKITPDLLV